jgi:DNA-binding NtrC family response regulator
MRRVFAALEKASTAEISVLIQGETGTGKELAAEAIHLHSSRKDHPFVVVDCGALPPQLIESELFGHERGAFTGADSRRAGVFEQADGGTVFLDEIGELDSSLQTRLLRVLETGELRRVGGRETMRVDVRVVAATHRDLEAMVVTGDFREDLYYRLAVMGIRLPPLRERSEDIEIIAQRIIEDLARRYPAAAGFELSPKMLHALRSRRWVGNVRELRNAIERAVIMESEDIPNPDAVVESSSGDILYGEPYAVARDQWVGRFERSYIERALERYSWNVAKTARECQVDRAYVFRLIKKHDLKRKK